mmetsp:Transcript_6033/g.25633  ORF Transcript_6033/g.25633 Transcript_6033/m.25633 type:complete len:215 (-) Transcript_6033:187-831(-)
MGASPLATSLMFAGTYSTTNDAPSATKPRYIHVAVTQSSGLAPAVHRETYTGRNTLTGVMSALMVAMCCFGTPFSNSFSCVNVSAALNATARVSKTALSFTTEGSLAMENACLYAPRTVSRRDDSRVLSSASAPTSRLSATKSAEVRNTAPQNVMNPPRPTLPYALSTRNPVKETKKPAVCPTELHVLARPTFSRESIVNAQPSTAMSCDASNA